MAASKELNAMLNQIPTTYQALSDYLTKTENANPFALRKKTYERIEACTGRPLICYVTKTRDVPRRVPAYIDDSDLVGFGDLVESVQGDAVDVFIVSNGGTAEATERIVRLLRGRFGLVRFIVPRNAYSAATLLCFSGEAIVMNSLATLGPIDPQINGVPARAIRRAFEAIEQRLKEEGPQALTAYVPLISKYDLHLLELCKSAEDLSKELASRWLSEYMLGPDPRIADIVDFFTDYDRHKSHARSIDRKMARGLGLRIQDAEETSGLAGLVRSLYNQFEIFFDKMPFYKVFENAKGINWGRQLQTVSVELPVFPPTTPQPGPPERSGE